MKRKVKQKAKTLFDHKGQIKQTNIEKQMFPLHSCYYCKHLDRKKKVHHCGNFYGYRCEVNKTHPAGIRKDMFGKPREAWTLKHCSCGAFKEIETERCMWCLDCVYLDKTRYKTSDTGHKLYGCDSNGRSKGYCIGWVKADKELKTQGCSDGRKKK